MMPYNPKCYSPGSTGAGSKVGESSFGSGGGSGCGSGGGGSGGGGSGGGGSDVGGSAVGGSDVGGSDVGGSDVAGSEPPLPLDDPPDPPLLAGEVALAAAGGGEVAVEVALLIRVGVVVDRKVGISPGVSTGLLLSAVPVALSAVANIAAVAGAPAGKVSSGLLIVEVTVAAGVDSLRSELLKTKIKPVAMRTSSNNPITPIRIQVPLPIPDLAAGADVVEAGTAAEGAPAAVVPAATAEPRGGTTAAAGAFFPGTCMSTMVILSFPPA
jgi:hypothetical protein